MPSGPPLGDSIPGGSSDCRCSRHLFHSPEQSSLEKEELQGMTALGCTPVPIQVDWIWDTEAK